MNFNTFQLGICIILLNFAANTTLPAMPQKVTVSLDTASIRIGEQVNLRLNATLPNNAMIIWPTFADTLTANIEIVHRSKIDTSATNRKEFISYSQSLRITSFDTGYHFIPPIRVDYSYKGDTARKMVLTEGLYFKVRTVEVDTTKKIRDIKGPMQAPLTLAEILPVAGIVFGILLLIALVWYLLWRRKMNKPIFPLMKRVELPAWQVALQSLQDLDKQHLWQSGKLKEYYTSLTDILRNYLLNQFSIEAMEMVTDEIMEAVKAADIAVDARTRLQLILHLADFVKFAKAQPSREENSHSLVNARLFVEETRPKEVEMKDTAPEISVEPIVENKSTQE
jgi:hypothetical protein